MEKLLDSFAEVVQFLLITAATLIVIAVSFGLAIGPIILTITAGGGYILLIIPCWTILNYFYKKVIYQD